MKGGVVYQKAVTFIIRIWQGSDGTAKVSVRLTTGGPTQYFPSLEALFRYLEQAQKQAESGPESPEGLR